MGKTGRQNNSRSKQVVVIRRWSSAHVGLFSYIFDICHLEITSKLATPRQKGFLTLRLCMDRI